MALLPSLGRNLTKLSGGSKTPPSMNRQSTRQIGTVKTWFVPAMNQLEVEDDPVGAATKFMGALKRSGITADPNPNQLRVAQQCEFGLNRHTASRTVEAEPFAPQTIIKERVANGDAPISKKAFEAFSNSITDTLRSKNGGYAPNTIVLFSAMVKTGHIVNGKEAIANITTAVTADTTDHAMKIMESPIDRTDTTSHHLDEGKSFQEIVIKDKDPLGDGRPVQANVRVCLDVLAEEYLARAKESQNPIAEKLQERVALDAVSLNEGNVDVTFSPAMGSPLADKAVVADEERLWIVTNGGGSLKSGIYQAQDEPKHPYLTHAASAIGRVFGESAEKTFRTAAEQYYSKDAFETQKAYARRTDGEYTDVKTDIGPITVSPEVGVPNLSLGRRTPRDPRSASAQLIEENSANQTLAVDGKKTALADTPPKVQRKRP
jgi:hypothetical protein